MEKKIEMLHKLCDALTEELDEYSKKIEKADGMSAGDLEAVDKLTHALKSIKTTIAMMEAEGEDGGYSRGYAPRMGTYYDSRTGMSYADENHGGRSYARGRNNNPMGRNQYSREGGYSYADDMEQTKDEIRELAQKMPEEHRRKIERALDELR